MIDRTLAAGLAWLLMLLSPIASAALPIEHGTTARGARVYFVRADSIPMLDVNIESLRQGFWRHFPVAATMGALIALELAAVLMGGFRSTQPIAAFANSAADPLAQASNTKELGILIYTQYLYPLEVAAVILLVAIIAAIALTLRSRKDSKHQDPSEQVRVKASDRVQLVKMEPVRPEPPKAQEQP